MKTEVSIGKKSIPLAIGLNFLLPGMGYIYIGKTILGIGAFALAIAWGWTFILTHNHNFLIPLGFYLMMMIDMLTLGNKFTKITLFGNKNKAVPTVK